MNCTDFLAKLTDYFDGQIDAELLDEVKEHLGACHHCEVVVNTTRMTIDVYRSHEPYEFPEELSNRLCSAVMQRCRGEQTSRTVSGQSEVQPGTSSGSSHNSVVPSR